LNGFLLASLLAACAAPVAGQAGAPPARERPVPAAAQEAPAPEPAPEESPQEAPQQAPEAPAESPPEVEPGGRLPPASVDQPADARALFSAFAAMPGLEARFEEAKHLTLLAAPLRTRGTLYFMPPGTLSRVIEEPERTVVTISPTHVRMSGKDGVETIDLRVNADVRLFVTSLVRVFSGDEAALERSYTMDFTPGPEGWTLALTPREPPLSEMLADLVLRGTGPAVTELVLREPNGDRTVTRILEADTARRFTEEEQASLFGILPR
jgi:hypothetical protein